jgi:DNA-binding transcriptional MerR regulator/methylmalonyl-CoA mutase cobalamin-binding subunit
MPDIGRYRIQVVSELTGVPSPTLRAWERRYGIPTPARTAAAYRLYSDHDVAMVRRLRDLCANGMSIAEAAKMVRASEEGSAVLAGVDGDPYQVAARRMVDAITAFDARAVEREAARAQYLGAATTVFDRVFTPVMRRVGDLWHAGALSIAQEHIATQVIGDVVRGMMRLTNPDPATHTVLLACFAEEGHDLPLHGVSLRLASWGIAHVTLGVRTPPIAIADAVTSMHPSAVGLSLTTMSDVAATQALVQEYGRACGSTPWFVGGAGVAVIADAVRAAGGHPFEGDFAAARPELERILRRVPVATAASDDDAEEPQVNNVFPAPMAH